jgi:TFIIF-interacting CTD phosphatase-like protein
MNRQLLILDIDETLLHAAEQPLSAPPDYRVGPYHVYKRPHVDRFLRVADSLFDIAVWTSSGEDYAVGAIAPLWDGISPPKFVWSRQRCTRKCDHEKQVEHWVKDLKKVARLGYPLERVLVIDDSPEKLQRHFGNLIRISPFEGDPSDTDLARAIPFLHDLSKVENVRTVEKRGWRQKYSGHAEQSLAADSR